MLEEDSKPSAKKDVHQKVVAIHIWSWTEIFQHQEDIPLVLSQQLYKQATGVEFMWWHDGHKETSIHLISEELIQINEELKLTTRKWATYDHPLSYQLEWKKVCGMGNNIHQKNWVICMMTSQAYDQKVWGRITVPSIRIISSINIIRKRTLQKVDQLCSMWCKSHKVSIQRLHKKNRCNSNR